MSDKSNTNSATPRGLSADEIQLQRYVARLGVWKVVFGTLLVGVLSVMIPGAISAYTAYFDNERRKDELELSQQAAHQQYIKDFFTTAINQDIELRIRFADYFANLSGPSQEGMWRNYLASLRSLRDNNRTKINELEGKLVAFKRQSSEALDVAEFDRINRELIWANAEVGYIATERSTVLPLGESPVGKKVRLYRETTALVQRLAAANGPLPENSADLTRFWDLYRKDLIGVESRDFAAIMVQIGSLLKSPGFDASKVKPLTEQLVSVARDELANVSQAGLQQEQQQYQQQQQQQQFQQFQQFQQQQQQQQQYLPQYQ